MGAFVLTKMKETAEAYLGHPVSKAVITVPGEVQGLSMGGLSVSVVPLLKVGRGLGGDRDGALCWKGLRCSVWLGASMG